MRLNHRSIVPDFDMGIKKETTNSLIIDSSILSRFFSHK